MTCFNCGNKLYGSRILAKKHNIRFDCYGANKRIVLCKNCEVGQLIPQWTDKELDKIYKNYNQKKDFKDQKNTSFRVSKYLKRYMKKYDFILEVGCGKGDNVKYFRKKGYRVVGIDKDESVTNRASGILNYDVYDKAKEEVKYDLIYGLHILEHMKNPAEFINTLTSMLTPKGTVILELPNLEDPLLTVYKIKEFENFYYRPDHHFFFTVKSLYDMLYRNKICNCKIKRKQNYGIVNHLNWLIKRKPTNLKINIPIIDTIYKFILTKILKKSDTILLIIKRR